MRLLGATVWNPMDKPSKPVFAGKRVGSAWPFAGIGCQKDGPLSGCVTTARPRTAACCMVHSLNCLEKSIPGVSLKPCVIQVCRLTMAFSREGPRPECQDELGEGECSAPTMEEAKKNPWAAMSGPWPAGQRERRRPL